MNHSILAWNQLPQQPLYPPLLFVGKDKEHLVDGQPQLESKKGHKFQIKNRLIKGLQT